MSKKNVKKNPFEVIAHAKQLQRVATAKRLGVSTKLFESNDYDADDMEDSDELEEMTTYGYDAKQEVGHDAKQGKQKSMQSIDDPKNAGSDPALRKKGGNTHKEAGMLENAGAEMYADIPDGASSEEVRAGLEKAYNFYKGRSGRLNQNLAMQMKRALAQHAQAETESTGGGLESTPLMEASNKLLKTIHKLRKVKGVK